MCLRYLQKYLVHGALIESEILSSPLPHVFAELGLVLWALVLNPYMCKHLPSDLEMYLCVSWTFKNLTHLVLIEAEILTSPSPMYLLNLAQIWVLVLCSWVCQHLPSGLKYSYVSQELLKLFGAWGPNRNWDIDLPTPPPFVFATLGLVVGHSTLPTGG